MDKNKIITRLEQNDISFLSDLPEKLDIYLRLLKEWNTRMDLTAALQDDEIVDRHFVDSLAALKTSYVRDSGKWIDVGTGAGFPGLVLALARPDIDMTLLDAQRKRLNFLNAVLEETGINNARTLHIRAEDGAKRKELREQFDVAAARAVAPLNVLSEYLLPFVKTGGYALCWKGPALQDEIEAGGRAAHLLGGRLEMPVKYTVFGRDWQHTILPIRKIEKTAKIYPRKAGLPKTKPLGI